MSVNSLSAWGFVLVRCSYVSDEAWEAFFADFKERVTVRPLDPPSEHLRPSAEIWEELNARIRWTVVEDRERLEDISMPVASGVFQEWVESKGRQELEENQASVSGQTLFPRYQIFVYVDTFALGTKFHGEDNVERNYQPALVYSYLSLHLPSPEEWAKIADWPLEEEPVDSFIRIDASEVLGYFKLFCDVNDWYDGWEQAQEKIVALARETTGRVVSAPKCD